MFRQLLKRHSLPSPAVVFDNILYKQCRSFQLKRRHQPHMHKQGSEPKRLRNRHYIYDILHDENHATQPLLNVILTKYVPGLGNVGDRISVKQTYGYDELLLPGYAVYASAENLKKYENYESTPQDATYSSAIVQFTIAKMSRMSLSIVMSMDVHWILKPWHVRASFRKSGYEVPLSAIQIPSKEIKGPSMKLENREFYVTVKINNKEQVNVRCRIHHWSRTATDKLVYEKDFFLRPAEPIFEEDRAILQEMPNKFKQITEDD